MCKMIYALSLTFVPLALAHAAETSLRVVDEKGAAVDDFEIMWHTAQHGYSLWSRERNGLWKVHHDFRSSGDVIDVIVRADGFASRSQRFEGESLDSLLHGKDTIVLHRGTPVTIEAKDLASPVPDDLRMESFFSEFTWRVQTMWQPINLRGQKKPDWNMLNVRQVDESHFSFRAAEYTGEFYLAFQHPGWLQFCKFGPFQGENVAGNGIVLAMPLPAKIHVTFDPNSNETDRPFESAKCTVYWMPDESGAVYSVADDGIPIDKDHSVTIADLGPGQYLVDVRTIPKADAKSAAAPEISPGQFFDRETVTLQAGESADVAFAWKPFDPNAWHGDANVEITVRNRNGKVPAGKTVEVSWFDGHYGSLQIFSGALPQSGIVGLSGISGVRHRSALANSTPYTISIDGERLGFFALRDTKELQRLEFSPSPKVGDPAPDIDLIAVDPQEHRRLSDYRGKIVLLEFWATWCGPCQPAMQKLSKLAGSMPPAWVERVVLLSLSTDRELEKVRTHVVARGWDGMPHFCAARQNNERFSDAEKEYAVYGIPHAILIDQDGTIRWRGHPGASADDKTIEDRIEELLP